MARTPESSRHNPARETVKEEIVVADDGNVAVFAAAMDGDAFAENVAVSDTNPSLTAAISQVLRLITDYDVGMKDIVLTEVGSSQDRHVGD